MKDEKYYSTESTQYSAKRYPKQPNTFVQSFFLERRRILIERLDQVFRSSHKKLSVLEIGCADGVILNSVYELFATSISSAKGIDLAEGMIKVAKEHGSRHIEFSVRNPGSKLPEPVDLILEIGVVNYLEIDKEMSVVANALAKDGNYFCSISGKSSLLNRFRPYGSSFHNLRSYEDYEELLGKHFRIVGKLPVGLFVPILWKLPYASLIQSSVEKCFQRIVPNMYLEKIYHLQHK